MFKHILFCTMLASHCILQAQTSKTIKPKPVKAIVYLSGAELSYLEALSLGTGTTELIVEGVSPGTDENSISAYFKGGMVIDTKKSLRYPEPPKIYNLDNKYQGFIERITDSLEELEFLLKDCYNRQYTFEKEKTLLLNNRLIKGEFLKDSLNMLKASLDLLRSRLTNIYEQELLIERKLAKLNKLKASLNGRKDYYTLLQQHQTPAIQTEQYRPIHQIVITIETEQAVTGNLSLKYYVASAGWLPMYEIQANSGKEKIQLVYRAQVYQNTGIDWKDVALVLSTSNPSLGNTKPTLNAWNLYYGYPDSYIESVNKKMPMSNYGNINQYPGQLRKDNMTVEDDNNFHADTVQMPVFTVNDNFFRTEYEIKTRYSIQADNKAHNVIINNMEIPVSLAYMAVPKLDKDAFLMGKVANWEELNLLPATAKIYFDESYIGVTVVDPVSTKDTLYLNLGRDKSIVVKRIAIKEKCREQVIGDDRIVTKTIEISIRNTKAIHLEFEIEDQVPVSGDNSIKITVGKNDASFYNEATGKLTWKLDIKPKDSKKIQFSYEIRYPKDKVVAGL